jgi:transketolase C-terminal domain/subunit
MLAYFTVEEADINRSLGELIAQALAEHDEEEVKRRKLWADRFGKGSPWEGKEDEMREMVEERVKAAGCFLSAPQGELAV